MAGDPEDEAEPPGRSLEEGDRPAPSLVFTNSDYAIGRWRNVLVMIWRGETTAEAMERFGRLQPGFAQEHPGGVAQVAIVETTAPPPSSHARKTMAKTLNDARGVHASAVVFDGTGIHAALVRSFVAGLNMLIRMPYPHQVFATDEDAAAWMATRLQDNPGGRLDAGELVRALGELRRAYQT